MPRRRPVRTCVACQKEAGKGELVRFVRRPDSTVQLDRTGRLPGRGAYIHASIECMEAARKRRSLERALGAPVDASTWAEVRSGTLG